MALAVALLAMGAALPCAAAGAAGVLEHAGRPETALQRHALPRSFEANLGQTDARARYLARTASGTVFLTDTEAVVSLPAAQRRAPGSQAAPDGVLRLRPLGANPRSRPAGLDRLPGVANYVRGAATGASVKGVPLYARVQYARAYPGVDLVYYCRDGRLEHDFVVAKGADPRRIAMGLSGSDRVRLDVNGDLVLRAGGREVRLLKPIAYQEVRGARRQVPARYVVEMAGPASRAGRIGEHRVRFSVGRYDRSRPLVIDPILSYSTYAGGNGSDTINAIALGADRSIYVAGETASTNFPVGHTSVGGTCDVFVMKFNTDVDSNPATEDPWALVYSTFLGGSGSDYAAGVAVDSLSRAYLVGHTSSNNFPVANTVAGLAGEYDAYAFRLNADGDALEYGRIFQSSRDDLGVAIAVDSTGAAFVASQYAISGTYHGLVTKIKPDNSGLDYSATLQGNNHDYVSALALGPAGRAYVTGYTLSTNFPMAHTPRGFDTYVVCLQSDGVREYGVLHGGASNDFATGVAVDGTGCAFVGGSTNSADFPSAHTVRGINDTFVMKLNASGGLVWGNAYGGVQTDDVIAISLDSANNSYIAGSTSSNDFPTAHTVRVNDAFVMKVNSIGQRVNWVGGVLGGTAADKVNALALDTSGATYIAGSTSYSATPPVFPTTPGAFQTTSGTSWDGFVGKFVHTIPTATAKSYTVLAGGVLTVPNLPTAVSLVDGATGDGDQLEAALVTSPRSGVFTTPVQPDGSFVYVPNPGFQGWDSFTFKVTDGLVASPNRGAKIFVAGPNPQFQVQNPVVTRPGQVRVVLDLTNNGGGDALNESVVSAKLGTANASNWAPYAAVPTVVKLGGKQVYTITFTAALTSGTKQLSLQAEYYFGAPLKRYSFGASTALIVP